MQDLLLNNVIYVLFLLFQGAIPGDIRTDGYKIPVPVQAPYHYDHMVASHPYSL